MQDVRTRACAPSATCAAAASHGTRIALAGEARRRPCFKRSPARVSRTFLATASRQPIAYACLAWRDKARALHYVCCTPFLWCHVALNFFFLLSENAHICTFQLFFFPKERIRIYRFCDKERFINQFACYLNNVCF